MCFDYEKGREVIQMKKPIVRKSDHERGMILVVAIIVIVAMLIMATPFLAKLGSQYRITDKSYKGLAAFNLAEEGIDRALWEMNQPYAVEGGIVAIDEDGNGTLVATNEAVGDKTGIFQGVITTNYGVEPNVRTLASTGSMPHIANLLVNRTVSVNMEKYFKSIWDYGIFADEGIWTKTNFKTYSFNSDYGAYGSTKPNGELNKGMQGHAGTNANTVDPPSIEIQQGSASYIHGNLASGVGTEPTDIQDVIYADQPDSSLFPDDIDGTSGTRKILSAPFELPPVDLWNLPPRDMFSSTVDFHDWFTSQPPVESPLPSGIIATGFNKGNLSSSETVLTPSDSGVYTNFTIPKNKTLTVQGNVAIYVTGLDGATADFSGKNANINIAADSSLTLILGKTTASIQNNVAINNSGTAPNCLILGTEQFTGDFSVRNNADFNAALYMPQAKFLIDQANFTLRGAVVCDYIEVRNNLNFYYDEALGDLDYIKGGIPYWRVTTWQELLGD
jgi:hypothetical protein